MSKYDPLNEFFQTKDTVTLTYEEIEEILGFKLPDSAFNHVQWWENDPGHPIAKAWLNAGWRKKAVNLGKDVTFIRSAEL